VTAPSLQTEPLHLARLLEAVQHCAFHMDASARKLPWPQAGDEGHRHRKDIKFFETMAAFNERFAELQGTLGAVMRHAALLMGDPTSPFLRVLPLFEKLGVIESVAARQLGRTARNLAAYDYDTESAAGTIHFNALNAPQPSGLAQAQRLSGVCASELDIRAATDDFTAEFNAVQAEVGLVS
jgi:hypothetical protein